MNGWAAPSRALVLSGVLAVLAVLALFPAARAAELLKLDVTRDGSRYRLLAEVYMEASPEAIFAVVTDYDNLDRISNAYKESGYLDPAPDGTPIVHTRMEGCLAFVCRSVRRVERLEARYPNLIRTIALPEHSDVRYGRSLWRLEPDGRGTRLVYEIEMEPDFGVPPIVGPWFLKRSLRNGGARAVERIERLARDITETGERGGALGTVP